MQAWILSDAAAAQQVWIKQLAQSVAAPRVQQVGLMAQTVLQLRSVLPPDPTD
jgi:hypothetical protein